MHLGVASLISEVIMILGTVCTPIYRVTCGRGDVIYILIMSLVTSLCYVSIMALIPARLQENY